MEIITKNFNGFAIDFSTNSETELYLNATQIAKQFNKQASKWLENKDTKEYIEAIYRKQNFANGDLVVIKQGGNPQEQGTWIHKKLIIAFARWLSPDFAVWCDMQIEDILKTGSFQAPKFSEKYEKVQIELLCLNNAIENLKVNEASKILMTETLYKDLGVNTNYLPKYSDENHSVSLSSLLKKFNVGMSANKFNKLLIEKGFLEIQKRKSSKTETNEKGEKIPIYKEFKSITKKGEEFGKNKVSTQNQLQTQPHYFENKFEELLEIIRIQKTLF